MKPERMVEPQKTKNASRLAAQHPATQAWRELRNEQVIAESIEILQDCLHKPSSIYLQSAKSQHSGFYEAASIYRLTGIGPGGANVIAKRCELAAASRESWIYENVLRHLPVSTLRYFGLLADVDQQFCWLFLEDGGDEPYSLEREEHRVLAGYWLGAMNVSAQQVSAAARLPDRGPKFYLEMLIASRKTICEIVEDSSFRDCDSAVLRALISHCDALERRWNEVERFCNRMPRTLVHGDFAVQNARVRIGPAGNSLLIMDWEGAGWGIPAADLAQFVGKSLNPDIRAYHSVVSSSWEGVELAELELLAELGRMFRLINGLDWANWGFHAVDTDWYMEKMKYYEQKLAAWIQASAAWHERLNTQ